MLIPRSNKYVRFKTVVHVTPFSRAATFTFYSCQLSCILYPATIPTQYRTTAVRFATRHRPYDLVALAARSRLRVGYAPSGRGP